METLLRSQFLRFLLAGGIAAAANFLSRILFSFFVAYEVAIILAYLVGMSVAFVLMRGSVFRADSGGLSRQVVRFSVVNLLAIAQTLVISLLVARWILPAMGILNGAEMIGHAFGVAVPIFTSYVGHRLFTFRTHESQR